MQPIHAECIAVHACKNVALAVHARSCSFICGDGRLACNSINLLPSRPSMASTWSCMHMCTCTTVVAGDGDESCCMPDGCTVQKCMNQALGWALVVHPSYPSVKEQGKTSHLRNSHFKQENCACKCTFLRGAGVRPGLFVPLQMTSHAWQQDPNLAL